jgi:hypothetical protein
MVTSPDYDCIIFSESDLFRKPLDRCASGEGSNQHPRLQIMQREISSIIHDKLPTLVADCGMTAMFALNIEFCGVK